MVMWYRITPATIVVSLLSYYIYIYIYITTSTW